MLGHCAADAVGDIFINIDADAATNVVGLEAGECAVVHEMFYRLVRLQHLRMSENSEGLSFHRLNELSAERFYRREKPTLRPKRPIM